MPESGTPACLHDPDARPIRNGRLGIPVEFGNNAQIENNDDRADTHSNSEGSIRERSAPNRGCSTLPRRPTEPYLRHSRSTMNVARPLVNRAGSSQP
jgi:hypothetical protein